MTKMEWNSETKEKKKIYILLAVFYPSAWVTQVCVCLFLLGQKKPPNTRPNIPVPTATPQAALSQLCKWLCSPLCTASTQTEQKTIPRMLSVIKTSGPHSTIYAFSLTLDVNNVEWCSSVFTHSYGSNSVVHGKKLNTNGLLNTKEKLKRSGVHMGCV